MSMLSRKPKDRSFLSQVPSLPTIGSHSNTPGNEATMVERISILEESNKALLEELMHLHSAIKRDREHNSEVVAALRADFTHQLGHFQSVWEKRFSDSVTSHRQLQDRVARLEYRLHGLEGRTDKQQQWIKDSFSGLHGHLSWLTNKMESTVSNLGSALDSVQEATQHSELVAIVKNALGKNMAPLGERITVLEKMMVDDQKNSQQLSQSVRALKQDISSFSQSIIAIQDEHSAKLKTFWTALTKANKENTENHLELSTVLKAEIKTRQSCLNGLSVRCSELQEMCRGSVGTLREALLSLEERITGLCNQVHTVQSQQELHHKQVALLGSDQEVRFCMIDQEISRLQQKLNEVSLKLSGPHPETLTELTYTLKRGQGEDIPVAGSSQHKQTKVRSSGLVTQTKTLLTQVRDLETSQAFPSHVLNELEGNLRKNVNLMEQDHQTQVGIGEASSPMDPQGNNREQSLCEDTTALDESNEVPDDVPITSKDDLEGQTKEALTQTQSSPEQEEIMPLPTSTVEQSEGMDNEDKHVEGSELASSENNSSEEPKTNTEQCGSRMTQYASEALLLQQPEPADNTRDQEPHEIETSLLTDNQRSGSVATVHSMSSQPNIQSSWTNIGEPRDTERDENTTSHSFDQDSNTGVDSDSPSVLNSSRCSDNEQPRINSEGTTVTTRTPPLHHTDGTIPNVPNDAHSKELVHETSLSSANYTEDTQIISASSSTINITIS